MIVDPEKMLMWAEAAAVTEEQKVKFKVVSELLISAGRVERLTEEAAAQAIDKLAYEIVKLSFETAVGLPHLTNDEVTNHEAIKPQIDKMDEILITIAFGSGIHKAVIDVMVGERCDYWTEQLSEQLTLITK